MDVDAHVRRLWRHHGTALPTPRRGPRQQLDLDEILEAAIAIADHDGLAAVSTRLVAARFGKTPMALYPYVGTKENLLALMSDHASAMPAWTDPGATLGDDLQAWAGHLFAVYLAHPWLPGRPWSQGPHEQEWLERLATVLTTWQVPARLRPPAITTLYAVARSAAETSAAYRRMDDAGTTAWLAHAASTARQIPDLRDRYPHSTGLEPLAADWRETPRAGLIAAVTLLSAALA
ncbi:TetR/AcrR family transcriptional regulator [Actinoplanes sp. NPDC051494]|uniref:TetR/AcrR family transcriptional regulator n=1 Tax=Actinoplanes sp. NPDC051494 TaxID=3363907 RepID=UPI00378AD64B